MMKKGYDYNSVIRQYESLQSDRSEWIAEWRSISDYLLPGRGIYQFYSKPRKRKLTSPKVINTVGEDSLGVLTSGLHGGLTSPAQPWFKLGWGATGLSVIPELERWLQECEVLLHKGLHSSSFYSIISSFYTEHAGFGTGCMYVGEDTDDYSVPFRFELLTAGEYTFTLGPTGKPNRFYRVMFESPRNLVEEYGDKVSDSVKKAVENEDAGIDSPTVAIMELTVKEEFEDKGYTRFVYEYSGSGHDNRRSDTADRKPLLKDGFYEFPYPLARWSTIGSDSLGVGPGSRALPDIRRLQEMEKSFLAATHKSLDPPLQAPARLKGSIKANPGDITYTSNPNEKIEPLYQVKFDYQGVGMGVERVEHRIKVNFFNDIFLTTNRDPNATPYKAAEVVAREQEKMLRLGPVIERLQNEFLQPLIERCFNIMLRKKMFPEIDPELLKLVGEYKIKLVSPLAVAQRAASLQGINSYLAFVAQGAQIMPGLLDWVNEEGTVSEYLEITGTSLKVANTPDQVKAIREDRQQQQNAKMKAEMEMMNRQVSAEEEVSGAKASRDRSEAALNMVETQRADAGVM